MKYKPTVTRTDCQRLADIAGSGDTQEVATAIARLVDNLPGPRPWNRGTWGYYLTRLADWVESGCTAPTPHAVYARGNSKLPFISFSTLPGVTCPGAGDCLAWCYSFRAWRYPASFCRQLQNTLLMRFNQAAIVNALRAELARHSRKQRSISSDKRRPLQFRLYVDGDFSSLADVGFWFGFLAQCPAIQAYGYSKSWGILQSYVDAGGMLPDNYKLNLSSGSRHDSNTVLKSQLQQLPIYRGEFVGVELAGGTKGFARFADKAMHAGVRDKLKARYPGQPVFSCPGQCGTCTASDHACGSNRFNNVVIGIGIH